MRSIQSEADYQSALNEVETLMHAKAGTAEGKRLDALVTLIQDYERKHYKLAGAQSRPQRTSD